MTLKNHPKLAATILAVGALAACGKTASTKKSQAPAASATSSNAHPNTTQASAPRQIALTSDSTASCVATELAASNANISGPESVFTRDAAGKPTGIDVAKLQALLARCKVPNVSPASLALVAKNYGDAVVAGNPTYSTDSNSSGAVISSNDGNAPVSYPADPSQAYSGSPGGPGSPGTTSSTVYTPPPTSAPGMLGTGGALGPITIVINNIVGGGSGHGAVTTVPVPAPAPAPSPSSSTSTTTTTTSSGGRYIAFGWPCGYLFSILGNVLGSVLSIPAAIVGGVVGGVAGGIGGGVQAVTTTTAPVVTK